MTTRNLVSIVIPTLNEGDLLSMTVESILDQTTYADLEIIIVDDGSTDGSCDPYVAYPGPVRVLRERDLGVARARNRGADVAEGEFLVFLDGHCTVSPDWLDRITETLRMPGVGVVGPSFTKLHEAEPRGAGMVWPDYRLDPVWLEPVPGSDPYPVPMTTGACQAFSTETFSRLGRYSEDFTRWGFEDTEICLRAWLLGYAVVVVPEAVVAHFFREARNYSVDDRLITYNFLFMLHLHMSAPRIRKVLRAVSNVEFLSAALDDILTSNVFQVRSELERARVHDDAWFFEELVPMLTGLECREIEYAGAS